MRTIKDAKDVATGDLIYFKGHAKATYMSDGSTVEDAILTRADIPVIAAIGNAASLEAGKYYVWADPKSSLTIGLKSPVDGSVLAGYQFEFVAADSGCTLELPASVKWAKGASPEIEPGLRYQVSIINGLGVWTKYDK